MRKYGLDTNSKSSCLNSEEESGVSMEGSICFKYTTIQDVILV
jgi:hypothetical protein